MLESPLEYIFIAFANDYTQQARFLRALSQEQREIRYAFNGAIQAGRVEVIERANATLEDIVAVFQDPRYAGKIKVFHYGGHANGYKLMLESSTGQVQYANADAFARFLGNQKSLELVFLNGCATLEQATALRKEGVPCVIATSTLINDAVALKFAKYFYNGMGRYLTIQKSYQDTFDQIATLQVNQGATRDLYWEEAQETEIPQEVPWKLIPQTGTDWRINPPKESGALIGEHVTWLCNRRIQKDDFDSALSLGQELGRMPHIYLIHGVYDDNHGSLISRFSYESIGKNVYIRPKEIKNWPVKGELSERQRLLKTRIMEQMEGANWTGKTANSLTGLDIISQIHFTSHKNVIFQHNIEGSDWSKETTQLIEWYVNDFWGFKISDPNLPNVIVFINVYYSPDQVNVGFFKSLFSKTFSQKNIIEAVQELEKKYKEKFHLISELGAIYKNDIDAWLEYTALKDLSIFFGLGDTLFTGG
ncbi:MAG: CHAT domain-containing protein, partial [Bacteroidia bacterium]